MATTTYGINDPLAVKRWSRRMDVEALYETVASEYMGTGSGSLIQEMTETKKDVGDSVRWGIRLLLNGEGTSENETQEGNEEAISRYNDTLVLNELGHAVRFRWKTTIDYQRVPYDLRDEANAALKDWSSDRIDTWFFNQLAGNTAVSNMKYLGFNAAIAPTANHVIRPNSLTTDQAVGGDTTANFKLSFIDRAVNKAEQYSPMMRPIKGLGPNIDWVCFIHPDQELSLRADTVTAGNWFDLQGKRLQGGEGNRNGLYTGAMGVYNRTLIVKNKRVPQGVNSTTGASVVNTRRAIFCGAQAGAIAFGRNGGDTTWSWVEEAFDYKRDFGVRASTIAGMKKTTYNGVDYGTIVIPTYAAPA